METQSEIARQQLQSIVDHLMLQFGSVLFLSTAYLFAMAALIAVICNWRRIALIFFFIIGGFTFLVPPPLTFALSPAMMPSSLIGLIWISTRHRATSSS